MSAPVYVARGRKYHADENCPLMVGGEGLWAAVDDGEGWPWHPGTFRQTDTAAGAALRGKFPCLFCTNRHTRAFPPLYGQTFSHEPWFVCLPDFTKGWACARCRVRTRCVTVGSPEDNPSFHMETHAVPWSCTSAVVLGLVDHSEAAS